MVLVRNLKRTFIIAEIGNSHEGSVGLAKQFIKVAAESGADAVKLQTHIYEAESLPDAPNPPYFKEETRKEYFERTAFDQDQWIELKRFAEDECEVEMISSPFSLEAVDLLEKVGLKTYKIPSGEVTNLPLLKKITSTKKKVLLSSGMSSWEELDRAMEFLKKNGCYDPIILQCTSEYPCTPEHCGLNMIPEMKARYQVQVGFSDHTEGLSIPLAASLMGVVVIEKHFTLSKKMYGSDAKFSLKPKEFREMVKNIREVELAIASPLDKDQMANSLKEMKYVFEKSIVTSRPLLNNHIITESDLNYKKPGDGISASEYSSIIGKKLNKNVSKNYKLKMDDFY
jgi:sialic acid synthase SpsE